MATSSTGTTSRTRSSTTRRTTTWVWRRSPRWWTRSVREKGRGNTLLIDAGDTIQGTPLSYYYAKVDPITAKDGPVHPMAQAMNAIGYDAAALGNHEFNYGIAALRKFEAQCGFPLLGANALDAKTLRPAFPPYWMKRLCTRCAAR